ncbi:unnamed protein product [Mesocestoides corti]|nr:unnamed protein product [Mesocestoides corti]
MWRRDDSKESLKNSKSLKHFSPNFDVLEPEKTDGTVEDVISHQLPPAVELSLVRDFEAQGPRDDPFVVAELGTINDLEELRDVLASVSAPCSSSHTTKQQSAFSSLKNINFPRLSVDENPLTATSLSEPGSQTNLVQVVNAEIKEVNPSLDDFITSHCSNIDKKVGSKDPSPRENSPTNSAIHEERVQLGQPEENQSSSMQQKTSVKLPTPPHHFLLSPISPTCGGNTDSLVSSARDETPSEAVDTDPPTVLRLLKMGFRRRKIIALHDAGVRDTHECDEDTLITQLCNWTELEEKGVPEEVGRAAVLFSPTDLGKAWDFATMILELTEMGFPVKSAVSAVQDAKMDKEVAVLQLLGPANETSSVSRPQVNPSLSPNYRSSHNQFSRGGILGVLAGQVGKKNKIKDKKSHAPSSYLPAEH